MNGDTEYAADFAEGAKLDYTVESEDIVLPKPKTAPDGTPNFVGWYLEKEFTTPVDKIAKGSTGDKTFYARWSEKAVRAVTFKFVGGEGLADATASVVDGEKITVETAKAKISADYEAAGESFLFTDAECATAFDIATPITADTTTIYVKVSKKTAAETPPADSGNSGGNENTGGESGGNTQNLTGLKIGDKTYAFKDLEIKHSYGTAANITKNDDGTLKLVMEVGNTPGQGNYARFIVSFKEAVSIPKAKMVLTAKSDDFQSGSNTFKFAVKSAEKESSEIAPESNTKWIQKDTGIAKDFTAYEATSYGIEWSSDNSITAANFEKITELVFIPQTAIGSIIIQSIIFE